SAADIVPSDEPARAMSAATIIVRFITTSRYRLDCVASDYTGSGERVAMPETVGFIGLGVMGRPMAKHLIKGGHALVVHSRSRGPVDEVVAGGATPADSPAAVAGQASLVITMLPDTA